MTKFEKVLYTANIRSVLIDFEDRGGQMMSSSLLKSWIRIGLGVVVIAGVVAVTAGRFSFLQPAKAETQPALADEGPLPDLGGAVSWLNSPPLSAKALRGKVVLVNFWTYSCINSLRELPYIASWAARYKDSGVIVIGVHTPEFRFEEKRPNVEAAVAELKIGFPVAVDSNHAVWQAFHNEYWPADYLVDGKGRIRYHHFGEGDYNETENAIRVLLRENKSPDPDGKPGTVSADGVEAPPSRDIQSPETYVGYQREERFASRRRSDRDSRKVYDLPAALRLNQWGLSGPWVVSAEKASLEAAPGKIAFRFHARDIHMVLGPTTAGKGARFLIKLDGAAPRADSGIDAGSDGAGEVREPRLYQLIRQKGTVRDRTFEIEFLDPGVEAFSFTFG